MWIKIVSIKILASIIGKWRSLMTNFIRFMQHCSIFLFITLNIYIAIDGAGYGAYFIFVPLIMLIAVVKWRELSRRDLRVTTNLLSALVGLVLLYSIYNNNPLGTFCMTNLDPIILILSVVFLCSWILLSLSQKQVEKQDQKAEKKEYFNILYVNISKVHEIAMLIDNTIMRTVEKEQISEELVKRSRSIGISSTPTSIDSTVEYEDTSKKKVYENFDVKMTKSIMLRRLYKKSSTDVTSAKAGQLILFKEIELERRNVDDTVLLLNVLQDTKMKNQGNDKVEINMSKMMEKMLGDFTIDYIFQHEIDNEDKADFIFQLPYKSDGNFENGYQHNDLQLGKLSLIGIYRGKVDFSQFKNVSSKFLETIETSITDASVESEQGGMKLSINSSDGITMPFEFKHKKLEGMYHLVDVIAIIQDLDME